MSTTIEDVDYLKQHGTREAHLLMIDSETRDRSAWPTASEYEVEFDTPFRLVYGVDVIDAVVPRTQYNVETYSNALQYVLYDTQGTASTTANVVVEPGDYEFVDLVKEFNLKAPNVVASAAYRTDLRTDSRSLKYKFAFTSPYDFMFRVRRPATTMGAILGFPIEGEYRATMTSKTTTSLLALPTDMAQVIVSEEVVSPVRRIRQPFVPAYPGKVFSVQVMCASNSAGSTTSSLSVSITDANGDVYATGNVDDVQTNAALVTAPMTMVAGKKLFVDASAPITYFVEFASTNLAYVSTYERSVATPVAQASTNGGATWTNLPSGKQLVVDVTLYKYELESPKICDLTGDRYVQLRCREIEQHLFRTRAYERHNAGLAKVQLGIFGFGAERFDYSSFPRREFHPIGKLSKMTLRFERPNGDLYDFKGVEHNLNLLVRYWTLHNTTTTTDFNRKILNPDYDPNVLEYIQRQRS